MKCLNAILVVSQLLGAQNLCLAQSPAKNIVKVAAAQLLTDTDDLTRNHRKIMDALRQAKSQGCDIILFHEGCLTGYPNQEQVAKTRFRRRQTG